MGLFDKIRKPKTTPEHTQGVVPFNDVTCVMKPYIVDGMLRVNIPVHWEPYESDRFRAKSKDGKTQISITNWKIADSALPIAEQLINMVNPLYERFVVEGGYEPHNDFIANDAYISKSFKVDEETQYYLTTMNQAHGKTIATGIIVRDIGEYDPEMRATLLIIASSIQLQ